MLTPPPLYGKKARVIANLVLPDAISNVQALCEATKVSHLKMFNAAIGRYSDVYIRSDVFRGRQLLRLFVSPFCDCGRTRTAMAIAASLKMKNQLERTGE